MVAHGLLARLTAAALCLIAIPITIAAPVDKRTGVVPSLSGPEEVVGSGTYPRANYLSDGSIISAYTAFANGDSIVTIARSTDKGVSWNEIGTVARGPTAITDIDNPYIYQLPSGRVLVTFRNHDRSNGVYTFFRITICYSDDNGANWAYLSTPASDPGPTHGNWEPFLRMAEDGTTLQLYYSRENSGADQDSLMRTSTNGGITWTSATVISGADSNNARDGMLGVTRVSGSNLIAVFESETNGGKFSIHSITSSDDGATWGNRQTVYAPAGSNAQAPQVIKVGGTLVASFQTDEDGGSGEAIKILTSGNGGVTWGNKLTTFPAASNWAGLLALNDGVSFLSLADHAGAKSQKITLY
uniref:Sialidase-1 n=1 Tax=Talaromyces marneffei PM1 TaxID=1077442 RepID=A0A093UZ17_TALMA